MQGRSDLRLIFCLRRCICNGFVLFPLPNGSSGGWDCRLDDVVEKKMGEAMNGYFTVSSGALENSFSLIFAFFSGKLGDMQNCSIKCDVLFGYVFSWLSSY